MKRFISIILTLAMCICPILSYADELEAEVVKTEKDSFVLKLSLISGPTIKLNGEKVELKPAAYIEGDNIYAPMSGLLKGFGHVVTYDSVSNTAIGIDFGLTSYIAIRIGSNVYTYSGKNYDYNAAPVLKDGTVFVPIRIIYEMLGYDVSYDEASDTVNVTAKK